MTESYNVRIEGLKEVMKKFDTVEAQKALAVGLEWGMDRVIKEMMDYPSETSANRPNADRRWYERGVGSHYQRIDGGISTQRTSEDMRRKWHKKLLSGAKGAIGTIWNVASYSKYVHGNRQSNTMDNIGWEKLEDIGKKFKDDIARIILKKFNKDWRRK